MKCAVCQFPGLNLGQIGDHSYFPAVRLASPKYWVPMPGYLGLLLGHPLEHPQCQVFTSSSCYIRFKNGEPFWRGSSVWGQITCLTDEGTTSFRIFGWLSRITSPRPPLTPWLRCCCGCCCFFSGNNASLYYRGRMTVPEPSTDVRSGGGTIKPLLPPLTAPQRGEMDQNRDRYVRFSTEFPTIRPACLPVLGGPAGPGCGEHVAPSGS